MRSRVLGLILALSGFVLVSATAATTPAPAPDRALIAKNSNAINDFGLRLLGTFSHPLYENTTVSPLSVYVALAMTLNGAASDTHTAMAKTLGLGDLDDASLNRANEYLIHSFPQADPKVELEIANALWIQSGFSIEPEFYHATELYDASAQNLDFAGDPDAALSAVNGWVDKNTHSRIPKILSRVDRATVLILTDAVYFKGQWTAKFDKSRTEPRDFHLAGGGSVSAPLMNQSGKYSYFEDQEFQSIRLPYGSRRFAMYVFLPRKAGGISDFLQHLDIAHWTQWTSSMTEREGHIALPKFESEWGSKLNGALETLGMSIAFDPMRADFSRIHAPPPRLSINDVEHKTWIKVDEEGTEAAAATSVGIVALAVQANRPRPFEMIVDHPFFFAIAEQQTGALLFAGVILDPTHE